MSKLDTEEITRCEIPAGAHVLRVYLQTHSAESETVFAQQLKEIQGRFEAEGEQRELDDCVKRVWDFIHRFESRSPMLVIFCTATGSLWARQIDVVMPNAVRWDKAPYWKPMIEAIDEFEQVLQVTSGFEQLAERRFEIRFVDQLVRLAAEHKKKVTLGIRPTLDALNDGRIWRLIYSEDFAARGGECLLCDSNFSSELELCKKCNVAVRPVDELMSVMVARALNQDASIEQVRGEAAARLNQVGGIGAFLRF